MTLPVARTGAVRAGLAFAALLLCPGTSLAQQGLDVNREVIEDLEFGLTCPVRIVSSEPAPGTENGRVDIFEGELRFVDSGQIVPAVVGTSFGVRARARASMQPMRVTIRSLHPALPGTGTTSQSFMSELAPGGAMSHIFTFDLPHEATPGVWQLQALAGDLLLYSVPFQVVTPSAYHGPLLDCGDPQVISLRQTPKPEPAA